MTPNNLVFLLELLGFVKGVLVPFERRAKRFWKNTRFKVKLFFYCVNP